MGDLKNTHYLDGIWVAYEGDQYEQVERQVRGVLAHQYNFKPDDKRADIRLQHDEAVATV